MKGKSKYLVILLIVLVVCTGLVTYARYGTRGNGYGNVNAARWNISFKNGQETLTNNFTIPLGNATWTNGLGNVASGKIAPGSSTTFNITLDATGTETDVDYTVELGDTTGLEDFEILVDNSSGTIDYSTETNGMVRNIPITILWDAGDEGDLTKEARDNALKNQNLTIPITIIASQKLALRYSITFVSENSTVASKKIDENTAIGTLPEAPVRVGYTFQGWYTASEGGTQVTAETVPSGGTIYYAHWAVKNITVTFNSNGGSSVSQQQVQEGTRFNSLPTTTKSGFNFLGWFDSNDNELTTSTVISDAITYTAKWEKIVQTGTLVYYDPVSTNTCNSSTYGSSSTCYKWRVIDVDTSGDSVNIQMDHNLVNFIAWNSDGNNNHGPVTALTQLASATSGWTRVSGLNYTYDTSASSQNYGSLNCSSGTCTISKTGAQITNVKARLITADEVALAANNTTWSLNNQSDISNLPSWLIDNDGRNGYWTLTPTNDSSHDHSSIVHLNGNLYGNADPVNVSSYYGVRPVIKVAKIDLN